MPNTKRKNRPSPAKPPASAPADRELGGTESGSPATKQQKTYKDVTMGSASNVEKQLMELAAGQTKLFRAMNDLIAKVDTLERATKAVEGTTKTIESTVASALSDLGCKLTAMEGKVGELQGRVATQAEALITVRDHLSQRRKLDLVVQVPEAKCNGQALEYVRGILANMGYKGHLANVRVFSFRIKKTNTKARDPLPVGSNIWVVEFTVEDFQSASDLRNKANERAQAGDFLRLGLNKTKREREDEQVIRTNPLFQEACKNATTKPRWDYGRCFLGEEEWTAARIRDLMGEA